MTTSEKRLNLHPRPSASSYNRVVQYGIVAAITLVIVTYLTVMSSRGDKPRWERPERFVTVNRPLILAKEKPPPLPQSHLS